MTQRNRFSLEGRVALLTGAAGHLGIAMANALAEAGAHVYLNGRNAERIEALASDLQRRGYHASSAVFDVRDDAAVHACVQSLRKAHGGLDVLVNNAYAGSSGTLETSDRAAYLAAYDLAVGSPAALVRSALGLLEAAAERHGSASVINIASMYALVSPTFDLYTEGPPNPPIYGPAKAALLQWTRYLACYLGPRRIRVNALSPGAFPAPVVEQAQPALVRSLAGKSALGRIGRPEDLSGALLFLASEASSFVTGSNLVVDGGWTAS